MKRQAFQNGGEAIVPKPKPLTESQIKNKLDLYIKGFIGGFDKMEMVDLMNDLSKKADESGVMSQEDVFEFVKERKDFYQKFLEENQGEAVEFPREKFAEGDGPGGPRPRTDLLFENLTRKQNAIKNKVNQRNASGFANLPGYDNITYTDYKNKKTGEIVTKYNVRIRIQDKNVQKIGTTADKYKNIDTLEEAIELRDEFRKSLKPVRVRSKAMLLMNAHRLPRLWI